MLYLGLPAMAGWLGIGMILIAVEMLVAPGSYLLWIGLAALAMALVSLIVSLGPGTELVLFGLLALAAAMIGVRVYGSRRANATDAGLDDPAAGLVGRELQLVNAIENGIGQARFGDSIWRVTGPDLPAGALVEVTALDGATLVVVAKGDPEVAAG
jgi:membrane protein implicated in regulation of membrane protease activity